MQEHEKIALLNAGLPRGVDLGVWSEVYLRYGDEDTSINYHFDFLISPISRDLSFNQMIFNYGVESVNEIEELKASAKKGKYITGKFNPNKPLPILPNLSSPYIIEVMTASTSGSDRNARTDIASSFKDAILGKEHNCPGINKRQVWGRMATQLFAKSALAEQWGGKTIWLVQDQLLKNIELTTKLKTNGASSSEKSTVNFLSMSFEEGKRGKGSVKFKEYVEIEAGLNFVGNNACTDILLPKVYPSKKELLKSVLRSELAAIVNL